MNCPDCGVKMVRHQHKDWPRQTHHCACGLVAYWAHTHKKGVIEVLEDPLDEEMVEQGIPRGEPSVLSPQYAHFHRQSQ